MTTRAVPLVALTGLGLPPSIVACLFDLDGALTSTASTSAAAWAEALDEVLRRYARRDGLVFVPFDPAADYRALVDGRPRDEGTRTFLSARGVVLAEGVSSDGPGADTVAGVGAHKSQAMARLLRRDGVHAFPGSVRYLRAARTAGLRCGVVSSSTKARAVLADAGMIELFGVLADGASAGEGHLRGKPHRTRSSPRPTRSGCTPVQRRCSRMPWRGSRPGARAVSATWSGSTLVVPGPRCTTPERMWWTPTSTTCSGRYASGPGD